MVFALVNSNFNLCLLCYKIKFSCILKLLSDNACVFTISIASSDEGPMLGADGVRENHSHSMNNAVLAQRLSGNEDNVVPNNIEEPAGPLEPQPALITMPQVSVY